MTESEIKKVIGDIHLSVAGGNLPLRELPLGLSLLSLMYTTVSVNALDKQWGKREIFRKDISLLLHRLVCGDFQIDNEGSLCRKADILYTALVSLRDADLAVDESLEEKTLGLADAVLSEYFKGAEYLSDGREKEEDETFFRCMRLLLVCFYNIDSEEEEHPWMDYFRRKVRFGSDTVSGDGSWNSEISLAQAFSRIILLDMNSYMLLDGSKDDIVKKAFGYYCAALPEDNISLLLLAEKAARESVENLFPYNGEWKKDVLLKLENSLSLLPKNDPLYGEVFYELFYASLMGAITRLPEA